MIMILSFLFYVFVFYLGYKLLFEFILPLVRTTRQVRRGFRDMNQRMRTATTLLQSDLEADHFEHRRRLSDLNFWAVGPPREGFVRI